jgi:hypothetical protein
MGLSLQGGKVMKTNFELIAEIKTLAEKNCGENYSAFLWGCSSSLLTMHDLELILSILKDKETN